MTDSGGARVESRGDDVGAVVVTPSHQYPTGVPLLSERCHTLCEWACSAGGLVVEDDYDDEFRYGRHPRRPAAAAAGSGSRRAPSLSSAASW